MQANLFPHRGELGYNRDMSIQNTTKPRVRGRRWESVDTRMRRKGLRVSDLAQAAGVTRQTAQEWLLLSKRPALHRLPLIARAVALRGEAPTRVQRDLIEDLFSWPARVRNSPKGSIMPPMGHQEEAGAPDGAGEGAGADQAAQQAAQQGES